MGHFRWTYLAGAAAVVCSSVAIADDAVHGFCSDCMPNSTLSLSSSTDTHRNFGFSDSGNNSALFETDGVGSAHDEDSNDQGDDLHGKGHHGNAQGDNDQGDDDQGKGHPAGGPPISNKPGTVGAPEPGTATLLAAALLGFGLRQLRRRLPPPG